MLARPLVLVILVPVVQVAPVDLAAPVVKDSFSNAAVRAAVASRWAKCRRTLSKAAKS